MNQYRKVDDSEISEYQGLHEVGSPQYKRAQDRKRADIRRSERPHVPAEPDFMNIVTAVCFVGGLGFMLIVTLASI